MPCTPSMPCDEAANGEATTTAGHCHEPMLCNEFTLGRFGGAAPVTLIVAAEYSQQDEGWINFGGAVQQVAPISRSQRQAAVPKL